MRLSCALNHLLTYLLTYMRIDSNWTMALYKNHLYTHTHTTLFTFEKAAQLYAKIFYLLSYLFECQRETATARAQQHIKLKTKQKRVGHRRPTL